MSVFRYALKKTKQCLYMTPIYIYPVSHIIFNTYTIHYSVYLVKAKE